jgi:transposase InsO family protein
VAVILRVVTASSSCADSLALKPNREAQRARVRPCGHRKTEHASRRGSAPTFIRCDNGPELTAEALKDWCRFSGVAVSYIEPGAPWQNPYVESFKGHLRNELLDLESFNTLLEAQLLLEDWRLEYNHHRPPSIAQLPNPSSIRPPMAC